MILEFIINHILNLMEIINKNLDLKELQQFENLFQ
jgi:hypothetical protein